MGIKTLEATLCGSNSHCSTSRESIFHYENMPMLYIEFSVNNENFHLTKFDIFDIFAQNIEYGYTLELPR